MNTLLRFKPNEHSPKGKFDKLESYPWLYSGQPLRTGHVFVSDAYCHFLSTQRKSVDDYLTEFVNEVAAQKSERAKQYLNSYLSGQRVLWTFTGDVTVLLSLVVEINGGLSTVMYVCHIRDVCDPPGTLVHHAESYVRQAIERDLGVSSYPFATQKIQTELFCDPK